MPYYTKVTCNGIQPLTYQWEAYEESGDQRDYYRNVIAQGSCLTKPDAERLAGEALRKHVDYRGRIVNQVKVWTP